MNINKTILITGASRNLGGYLAKYFLNKNYNVISISKISKSSINKNSYTCDLSNAKKTNVLFKKIKKKYSKIDLLISCAGNSRKTFKINETSKDWKFAFDNNFYSFTNVLDCYSKIFKNKSTKIVVISTIASKKITKSPLHSLINIFRAFARPSFFSNLIHLVIAGSFCSGRGEPSRRINISQSFQGLNSF